MKGGRYQAYPEYKDTEIKWMGQIPVHWYVTKTSRLFKIAMGQTILKEDLVDEGEWPVFSATEGEQYLGRINSPSVRLSIGDIVIPARGNSIGSVKLDNEKATTTQTTIYCKQYPQESIFPKYSYYYMVGERKNLFRFTQTAIPQITTEEVGCNPFIIPSSLEQQQIINFLDYETRGVKKAFPLQILCFQLSQRKNRR